MRDDGVAEKGDWFKIHHQGWLEGSMRASSEIDGDTLAKYRGVMADLLALVSRSRMRDGTLRRAENIPMERDWLASVLNISRDLLDKVIAYGMADPNARDDKHRIEVWADGTIELVNWAHYQSKPIKESKGA